METKDIARLILLFHDEQELFEFVREHYEQRGLYPQRVLGPELEVQIPTSRTYRLAQPRKEPEEND